jgi:hypothetical protein
MDTLVELLQDLKEASCDSCSQDSRSEQGCEEETSKEPVVPKEKNKCNGADNNNEEEGKIVLD